MNNLIKFCIQLKNAVNANSSFLLTQNTQLINEFVKLLFKEGFIYGAEKRGPFLKITLKYGSLLTPSISNIRVISKPTQYIYIREHNLGKILKLDSLFLLTNKGFVTGNEAVKKKIGGKLICSIF